MFSYAMQLNLQCVEERMRGLISNLIRLSKQVRFFPLFLFSLELLVIKWFWILVDHCSGLILRNQDTELLSPQMFNNKSWQWIGKLGRNGKKNRLKQRSCGDLMMWVPQHFMRRQTEFLKYPFFKWAYCNILLLNVVKYTHTKCLLWVWLKFYIFDIVWYISPNAAWG